MPTARSWTEAWNRLDMVRQTRRAVVDVTYLVGFRAATLRRRATFWWLASAFVVVTTAAAFLPARLPGAGASDGPAFDALLLLPTALAGFLALTVVSGIASGGGRELIARDEAVAIPISPTTDHLGALLLAPLNIAWLLQAWLLLGATSFALGPGMLAAAQLVIVCWLALATAVAQVVAWSVEGLRRLPHGIAVVRALALLFAAVALLVQLSGRFGRLLDALPTRWVVVGLVDGLGPRWALTVVTELLVLVLAVAVGAVPAHLAARRTPRDELRVESETHPLRRMPRSVLAALVRNDRSSVWRAVPMRRGLVVLAVAPGLVALAGDLTWASMTILPGLVASGGALLFGVNAWCLDGRGALWRESLPVTAATVFVARAYVLAEFLLAASALTLVLASLRAGLPDAAELTALLCTWLVVVLQVVSAALRWSLRSPFAVDLRSARATPAPPLTMVGYSAKLAVTTTLTSLVFSGLARVPVWQLSVLVALPFLAWSIVRLLHARDAWVEPVARARVVTTVAV